MFRLGERRQSLTDHHRQRDTNCGLFDRRTPQVKDRMEHFVYRIKYCDSEADPVQISSYNL